MGSLQTMTPERIAQLDLEIEQHHRIWWDFQDAVDRDFNNGFASMEKIENYVNEHPEIEICGCDDEAFSGSDLVLVPHPDMGITVVYVPQCSGTAAQFFLYPPRLNILIDTLIRMRDQYFKEEVQ